jgi:hypothetical protein
MKQTTFASAAWDRKGKVTCRERFSVEMDAVISWERLLKLGVDAPLCGTRTGRGRDFR